MSSRRNAVIEVLNTIKDPCSCAAGVPAGLEEMGLIERLAIDDDRVAITLRPTFPGCLFIGLFKRAAAERLAELKWCDAVSVEVVQGAQVWQEDAMADTVRARLQRRRTGREPERG